MRAPTWSAGTPSGIGCVGDGDGDGLGQSSGVNAPVVVKNRNAATPAAAATSSHLERRTRIMQPPTTFPHMPGSSEPPEREVKRKPAEEDPEADCHDDVNRCPLGEVQRVREVEFFDTPDLPGQRVGGVDEHPVELYGRAEECPADPEVTPFGYGGGGYGCGDYERDGCGDAWDADVDVCATLV